MDDTRRFYDDLAADYHLNYRDWEAAVRRQGEVLSSLIRRSVPDHEPRTVLDCSCGIGTQAIGLALQGLAVTGTDLSSGAIERAIHEASRFKVDVPFAVADMRHLATSVSGTFDVVISGDNSVAHLPDDADLERALRGMREKLQPGGLLVVGLRDYDALVRERPTFTPPQLVHDDGQRSVLFQLWDWAADGASYQLTMFILKQGGDGWEIVTHVAHYRALQRGDLERCARAVGFTGIRWHMPGETGHHQPLMVAGHPGRDTMG